MLASFPVFQEDKCFLSAALISAYRYLKLWSHTRSIKSAVSTPFFPDKLVLSVHVNAAVSRSSSLPARFRCRLLISIHRLNCQEIKPRKQMKKKDNVNLVFCIIKKAASLLSASRDEKLLQISPADGCVGMIRLLTGREK